LKANGQNVVIRTGVKGIAEASKDSDMIIVIDVLRASSTIITALENGALSVFPTVTIREAKDLSKTISNPILAGERRGFRIPGFSLGNSPLEYTPRVVQGKNIVLTTSNCTRVLDRCGRLPSETKVVIGALLNAWAVAELSRKLLGQGIGKISIVQAGSKGRQSRDDRICADVLHTMIENKTERVFEIPVQSIVNLLLYSVLSVSRHGKRLIEIGYDDDLRYCCRLSISSVVPQLSRDSQGSLRITKSLDF
jgi:2-phosphosulfolactate phosphatase